MNKNYTKIWRRGTEVKINHRPRIALKTLGCKANRAESDILAEKLAVAGHKIVDAKNRADIYIINTCSVTNEADKKSRQAIRVFKHTWPDARIFVFGCGVRAHREFYKKMPEVELTDTRMGAILRRIGDGGVKGGRWLITSRTRAVIKIQDGCNNFCSYCVVRILRGREKNYPLKEILARINQKLREGYKEIVLTGINITSWKDRNGGARTGRGYDFSDLVRLILDNTAVSRCRISSMEPESVNARFAKFLKNPRLCPHIHLPLQSGSDKILKLMRRKYDAKKIEKACALIKSAAPDAAVTTDVIVGFPSETEKDFRETVRLCKKIRFAKIHVFPYSIRNGTPAGVMPEQVDARVKNQRAKILRDLSDKMRREFICARIGKVYEVLFEGNPKGGGASWSGFTPNYIKVAVVSRTPLENIVKKVRLIKILPNNDAIGEVCE